ncbi:MAG: SDR family oxidoreductase [Chitinophagaceae bacterium]|nr:SDR family oxidoreductase [Anaerolineae bacterium]
MSDKMAIITGAGQGMGRATALTFAKQGWHVGLVGRTQEKLDLVAGEIAALGGESTVYQLDVAQSHEVSALAESLADHTVDLLVNCAGESLIKPLEEVTDADWERILGINLKGPFLLCRALLPHLRRSENGTIVNIGSKTSMDGFGGVSVYSAAKTGLLGFTRSLASELKTEQIRVVLLAPGPANMPMRWAATPDYDPEMLIQPETVAEAVWWLASLPRGTITSEFLLESANFL